ncbi:mitochondrial carrier, partial [Coccomyxa subellipsoidea C-169]
PIAAFALVPQSAVLFAAGAVAGALGKTLTAPLDRVKLLLQTRGGLQGGALKAAARGGGVWDALVVIGREEGFLGYWKGNVPQILKVVPYSAIQLCSYEAAKRHLRNKETGELSVPARLAAGAFAGMTATLATYPLDTLRLRLAVDPASRSVAGAAAALMREGSHRAFFRGLGASMLGIAPYMALELAVFDLMPTDVAPFVRGFSSALLATTLCYPLDTVRRQIQLQSTGGAGPLHMAEKILHREGLAGFYRGFLPNALKNLPNKGVRLAVFDGAKKLLIRADEAYKEELEKADGTMYRLK